MPENSSDLTRKISLDTSDIDEAVAKGKKLTDDIKKQNQQQSATNSKRTQAAIRDIKKSFIERARQIKAFGEFRQQQLQAQFRQGLLSERKLSKEIIKVNIQTQQKLSAIRKEAAGGRVDKTAGSISNAFAGVGAGIGLSKISSFFSSASDDAKELETAFISLKNAARNAGLPFEDLKAKAAELSADGTVSLGNVNNSLKLLIANGQSLDQAFNTVNAVKQIAALENITGDASQSVFDTIKGVFTGSAELVENAGISFKTMAKEVGGFAKVSNNAAVRQKFFDKVIQQSGTFTQGYGEFLDSATGASKKLTNETKLLSATLGAELLNPEFTSGVADIVKGFREWFTSLQPATRQTILITGSVITLVPIIITLFKAIKAATSSIGLFENGIKGMLGSLKKAHGIAGLFILVAAALVAILSELNGETERNIDKLEDQTKALNEVSVELKGLEAAQSDLKAGSSKFIAIQEKLIKGASDYTRELILQAQTVDELKIATKALNEERKLGLQIQLGELVIQASELKKEIEETTRAIKDGNEITNTILQRRTTLGVLLEGNKETMGQILRVQRLLANETERESKARKAVKPLGRKKGKAAKPEEFTRESTTLEELQREQIFNDEKLAMKQSSLEQEAILEQQAAVEQQIRDIEAFTNLQELEQQKQNLLAMAAAETSKRRKKEIKDEAKLKDTEIKLEKKKLQEVTKLRQSAGRTGEVIAQKAFEFGQSLLDEERGSFRRFLVDQLRAFADFLARKLAFEGGARVLAGDATGALLIAGAVGIKLAAEVGAREIEKTIEDEDEREQRRAETRERLEDARQKREDIFLSDQEKQVRDLTEEFSGAKAGASAPDKVRLDQELARRIAEINADTSINGLSKSVDGLNQNVSLLADRPNVQNNQEINVELSGTFFNEAVAVRERLLPAIREIQAEQGEITFDQA